MSHNRFIPRVKYPDSYPDPVGHVAPSPSALSALLSDIDVDDNMEPCVCLRTDNYLILHQKDIENRIGMDNVRKWIDALNQSAASSSTDSRQQALDSLSDRDLFSLVRSRHIQAPAEVAAYAQSIIDDAVDLSHRRAELLAANAALAAEKQASQTAQPAE